MFKLKIDENLKLSNCDEELLKLVYHYKYNHKISVNIDFEKELREYKKSKVTAIRNSYEENLANSDAEKFIRVKEIELNSKINYEINNIIDTFLSNNSITALFDERDIFLKDKCESLKNTINYYINRKLSYYEIENIDCYLDSKDKNVGFTFKLNKEDEGDELHYALDLVRCNPYECKVTELNSNNIKNIVVPAYTYFLTVEYDKDYHQSMANKCKYEDDREKVLKNIDKISDLSRYYIGWR